LQLLAAWGGLAALGAALSSFGAGCAAIALVGGMADSFERTGSHKVYAEYEGLRGKSYAVVVSVDRAVQGTEPRLMTRLTNAITNMLVTNNGVIGASGAVPGPRVLEFLYNNPSWTSWSYGRLGEEFGVDRLILVDLVEYRLNEPGNAHVWEGLMSARVGVVDVESGVSDDFVFTKEIMVRFPDDSGVTRNEMLALQVSSTLEQRFVNRVAWLFFEHSEPNMIEY